MAGSTGGSSVKAVDKYLARGASGRADEREHLADLARRRGPFDAALVIPVRDEAPDFLPRTGLSRVSDQRVLVCIVLNAADASDRDRALLASAPPLPGPGSHEVVVIDRVSPGRAFGPRDGVGLARKIGLDLALALWRDGSVRSPWLHTTDADAALPPDHFDTVELDRDPLAVARVARFWHDTGAGGPVALATAHYEVWMRYYVAGLAHAGSPYAFDALGSCISVHARAYASAGGVPRRQAGEDFHLLAKLAKLGAVHRAPPTRPPVALRCRTSTRVPFGTGPGVRRIMAALEIGEPPPLHDPRVFESLASVLAAIDDVERPLAESKLLADLDLVDVLDGAARSATTPAAVRRRRHECFDALRTLQLVHRLRDTIYPDRNWREAIDAAPFATLAHLDGDDGPILDALRHELEQCVPRVTGLAARRS